MTDIDIRRGDEVGVTSSGDPRWLVSHECNGIARRITLAGHALACLDCGGAIQIFPVDDVESGNVVEVSDDGDFSVRDDR